MPSCNVLRASAGEVVTAGDVVTAGEVVTNFRSQLTAGHVAFIELSLLFW